MFSGFSTYHVMLDVPPETPAPFVLMPIAWVTVLYILRVSSITTCRFSCAISISWHFPGRESPLFVLSKCHPPSPDALLNPCLVDVVHRISGISRIASRNWVTTGGLGLEPGRVHWGLALAKTVLVCPGDVQFSQYQSPLPILHPMALHWSDWNERVLIKQKRGENMSTARAAVPQLCWDGDLPCFAKT